MTIERVREVVAYANRFGVLYDDEVRFADGTLGRYLRMQSGSGFRGVVVLPLRDGQVGLVRQFRYPLGRAMWEAPRGMADGPDAALEARRELWEETGATAGELIDLGVVHPDSGCLDGENVLFAAVLSSQTPFDARDEVDAVRWVPVERFWAEIADGSITDAMTITAAVRALLAGVLSGPT